MKVIKFMRFRDSAGLQKVICTESFCVLFFLKVTLFLRKTSMKKIQETNEGFEDCFEIDNHLVLYSRQRNAIKKISMSDFSSQVFNLPMEHNLVNITGCPTKRFLVAVTRNRKIKSSAIIFWLWNVPDFVYIFDGNPPPENITLLSPERLVVFGAKTLRLFDSNKIKFIASIAVDEAVSEVFALGPGSVVIRHRDESFSVVDLETRRVKTLPYQDLLFLEDSKLMLHLPEISRVRVLHI